MQIRLAGIVPESIVDGPGYRFAIFAQGCPHHCPNCHNPHTHNFADGKLYDTDRIIKRVNKFPQTDGITFTGGEPFCQPDAFLEIAKAYDKQNIWCYTGFKYEELIQSENPAVTLLLSKIDVLIDGKYIDKQRSYLLKFKGSKNQRIIDVKRSIKQGEVVLFGENS
jgi:anaerobic ribonucleoside-triphosphate reductase activating protein